MSRCHTTALARGLGAAGACGSGFAGGCAAGGLLSALLCGGACQGLNGVVGLGAGGQRGCEPGKDKGQQGVEPAGLGGG